MKNTDVSYIPWAMFFDGARNTWHAVCAMAGAFCWWSIFISNAREFKGVLLEEYAMAVVFVDFR